SSVPSSISKGSRFPTCPSTSAFGPRSGRTVEGESVCGCRPESRAGVMLSAMSLLLAKPRKAQLFALFDIGHGDRPRQGAHAQDVALSLGDGNGAPRIQQIEGMTGLHDLLVSGQRQTGFDQLLRLGFAGVEPREQLFHVGVLEVV